jgi:hypothetical protein
LRIVFSLNPNSDIRNLPLGPKPVFRINSNYLFGVEPQPSGWVQHHPELEGDTALSALQRGKVSQVLVAAENPAGAFLLIMTRRLPAKGVASTVVELAPIRTGPSSPGCIERATLTLWDWGFLGTVERSAH